MFILRNQRYRHSLAKRRTPLIPELERQRQAEKPCLKKMEGEKKGIKPGHSMEGMEDHEAGTQSKMSKTI